MSQNQNGSSFSKFSESDQEISKEFQLFQKDFCPSKLFLKTFQYFKILTFSEYSSIFKNKQPHRLTSLFSFIYRDKQLTLYKIPQIVESHAFLNLIVIGIVLMPKKTNVFSLRLVQLWTMSKLISLQVKRNAGSLKPPVSIKYYSKTFF